MRHATFLALLLAVPSLVFAAEPTGVHRKSVGKLEVSSLQLKVRGDGFVVTPVK